MSTDLIVGWLGLLPITAVLLAVVYVPGTVALALLRARPTVSLAGGPLITAAMLGIGGILLGSLELWYGWIAFVVLTLLLWAAMLVLRVLVVRRSTAGREDFRWTRLRTHLSRAGALHVLAGALALSTLLIPLALNVDPAMPSPRVDPMYHYNVLNAVLETGDVSMLSAVDYNYGLRVGHVTYPTVWHAIASLGVGAVGVIPAANAVAYLVTPVLLMANVGLLASVVFRKQMVATLTAVLTAGAFPAFPGGLLLTKAFWPNSLAIAMLPGVLVVLIMFLRRARWSQLRRSPALFVLDALLTFAVVIGLGFAHPSVLFSLVFIALPLLVAAALKAQAVVRRTLSRRAHRRFVTALIVVPVVLMVLVLIPRQVRSYILRPGVQEWDGLILKSVSLVANWPTDITNPAGIAMALVYVPMILMGLYLLGRTRERRWLVIAWLINGALVIGTYLPVPVLSGLSGLWYADTYRIFAAQVAILPLALGMLAQWAGRGHAAEQRGETPRMRPWRLLWAWGSIVGALLGTTYIMYGETTDVGVRSTESRPVVDPAEQALLERAGSRLPEDAIVIGDPASGVAYLPLSSDVDSVFTQMNLRDVDGDGIFLSQSFDDIGEDPRVCTLLHYYGIGYFYEDDPIVYNYGDRESAMPGFYDVDTSEGFTLIDEGGTAKLWRIDVCGPIETPADWWHQRWRRAPLVDRLDEDAHSGNPSQPE